MVDRINNLYEKVNKAKSREVEHLANYGQCKTLYDVLFPQEGVADEEIEKLLSAMLEPRLGNFMAPGIDICSLRAGL